jgi:16S rRNA (adenine1518-N6/adenine1519-N6)-dimethyltransferase
VTVRKRFGQHFLEPAWVAKVIDAIAPAPDEAFLEIGPGPGALTRPLAERCRRIIAVEIDRDLARALPSRVPQNVEVVTADVLRVDLVPLLRSLADGGRARVAGNLPYNISTPTLFAVLAAARLEPRVADATFMLQREVAERLTATPGSGDYGVLTITASRLARVRSVLTLPPGAFRPPPQVTSSLVRLEFLSPADVPHVPDWFDDMVRAAFSQRRKTMANALSPFASARGRDARRALESVGVDPKRRPETLSLDELVQLARWLSEVRSS